MLTSLGRFKGSARVGMAVITTLIPLALIGGLLYVAFFVKAVTMVPVIQRHIIEPRDKFLGIAMPNAEIIWAVGSDGKIIRSEDRGRTWMIQSDPVAENLQGIAAWDANKAVAVGNDAVVIRTVDGGKTWKKVQAPKSTVANKLFNVRAYADGVAWAVGEMGAVLKTSDFGQSWVRVIPEKDQAWNDISFFGNHGIMVGEVGHIMKTEDGGVTWQSAESGTHSSLYSVYLRDASNGVAVGIAGVVLVTHDGGVHWSVAESKTKEHLNDVIWDGSNWIAVGDKGVIVTGDAEGGAWKASRVSEGYLGWNTQVLPIQSGSRTSGYMLAGSSLSRLEGGKFTLFGRATD